MFPTCGAEEGARSVPISSQAHAYICDIDQICLRLLNLPQFHVSYSQEWLSEFATISYLIHTKVALTTLLADFPRTGLQFVTQWSCCAWLRVRILPRKWSSSDYLGGSIRWFRQCGSGMIALVWQFRFSLSSDPGLTIWEAQAGHFTDAPHLSSFLFDTYTQKCCCAWSPVRKQSDTMLPEVDLDLPM